LETRDKLIVEENYFPEQIFQYGWNLPILESDAWKDFYP
jgi:hypothetical protein